MNLVNSIKKRAYLLLAALVRRLTRVKIIGIPIGSAKNRASTDSNWTSEISASQEEPAYAKGKNSTPRRIYLIQNRSLVQRILVANLLEDSKPDSQLFTPDNFARLFLDVLSDSNDLCISKLAEDDEDIEIVPVRVFWGRAPDKEGSLFRIWLQKSGATGGMLFTLLALLVNGRNTFLHVSLPFQLSRLAQSSKTQPHQPVTPDKLARKLRLLSGIHFRMVDTRVLGPDQSHRRVMLKQLIRRHAVQRAIQQEAERQQIPEFQAEKLAQKYAKEIVSDLSYTAARWLDGLLGWLWNTLYDGIQITGLDPLRRQLRDHEVVYIPCHRSHIDYLLLSYVLYQQGLQLPQVAAGVNLNIPLVGSLLRKGGAFFMRRSFRGDPLYSTIFNEYLHLMLTRGYSTEFFIEGGRSRTGRTLMPKVGMVSMVMDSYLRDFTKPVLLVPIYIGYEKVFESSSYEHELKGGAKKKESLKSLFGTIKELKNDFGQVQVSFGNPLSLNHFLNQQQPDWRSSKALICDQARESLRTELAPELANQIVQEINRVTFINPINLVALALLPSLRQAVPEHDLLERIEVFKHLLLKNRTPKGYKVSDCSPEQCLFRAEKLGYLERQNHPLGDLIFANQDQSHALTYYKNNALHCLAFPALMLNLLTGSKTRTKQELLKLTELLYPYIQTELTLSSAPDAPEKQLVQSLRTLSNLDLIIQRQAANGEASEPKILESGVLEADGFGSERYEAVPSSHPLQSHVQALIELIAPTLERLYILCSLLNFKHTETETNTSQTLESANQIARRIAKLYRLNEPEFSDMSLLKALAKRFRKEQEQWESRGQNSDRQDYLVIQKKLLEQLLPSEICKEIQYCVESLEVTKTTDSKTRSSSSSKPQHAPC